MIMFIQKNRRIFSLLLIIGLTTFGAWGCGDSDEDHNHDHEEHGEEPADDACEHGQDGPFEDVTAVTDGTDAPDVSMEHTAYRIELSETDTDTFGGQVSFAPEEAGEFHVFLGVEGAEVGISLDGTDIAAEASSAVDSAEHCSEIAYQWTFDLDSAGDGHMVDISGSPDATVLMVIVHGGKEHGHEE
jgi:hypothetical protein